jgi:hypothetical protein
MSSHRFKPQLEVLEDRLLTSLVQPVQGHRGHHRDRQPPACGCFTNSVIVGEKESRDRLSNPAAALSS